MKAPFYKSLYTGMLFTAALAVSCASKSMEEPVLTKAEDGFFEEIRTTYNCSIKRTQTVSGTPKNASEYSVMLLEFPKSEFDKGDTYLKTEALRIAMQIKYQLFEKMDTSYNEVSIVFLTKSGKQKEFTYQSAKL